MLSLHRSRLLEWREAFVMTEKDIPYDRKLGWLYDLQPTQYKSVIVEAL